MYLYVVLYLCCVIVCVVLCTCVCCVLVCVVLCTSVSYLACIKFFIYLLVLYWYMGYVNDEAVLDRPEVLSTNCYGI